MAFDVAEADFPRLVVERSHELPVVVDFWAAWCGPCRALGPILEAAVAARAGGVELAKLDTEANPGIAATFDIRSIPAVKAFRDGVVVDEFVGALPRPAVEAFLDRVVPSEADGLVAAGAEADLRRALELEPTRSDAAVALARLLIVRGDRDDAAAVLAGHRGFAAEGLVARLELEADPALAAAFAQLDAGEAEAGLDGLLAVLGDTTPDDPRRDALRQAIVGALDELGVEHPLARDARRRLAAVLF